MTLGSLLFIYMIHISFHVTYMILFVSFKKQTLSLFQNPSTSSRYMIPIPIAANDQQRVMDQIRQMRQQQDDELNTIMERDANSPVYTMTMREQAARSQAIMLAHDNLHRSQARYRAMMLAHDNMINESDRDNLINAWHRDNISELDRRS